MRWANRGIRQTCTLGEFVLGELDWAKFVCLNTKKISNDFTSEDFGITLELKLLLRCKGKSFTQLRTFQRLLILVS